MNSIASNLMGNQCGLTVASELTSVISDESNWRVSTVLYYALYALAWIALFMHLTFFVLSDLHALWKFALRLRAQAHFASHCSCYDLCSATICICMYVCMCVFMYESSNKFSFGFQCERPVQRMGGISAFLHFEWVGVIEGGCSFIYIHLVRIYLCFCVC